MEIEKLKDMLRNAAGSPVGIRMCQEAADTLEQLQAENDRLKEEVQQMRWIPVKVRLPMPYENPVLVYDNSGVGMAWYSSTMGWMYRTGLGCVDVTHWMPLPAAPKEENKDD